MNIANMIENIGKVDVIKLNRYFIAKNERPLIETAANTKTNHVNILFNNFLFSGM